MYLDNISFCYTHKCTDCRYGAIACQLNWYGKINQTAKDIRIRYLPANEAIKSSANIKVFKSCYKINKTSNTVNKENNFRLFNKGIVYLCTTITSYRNYLVYLLTHSPSTSKGVETVQRPNDFINS